MRYNQLFTSQVSITIPGDFSLHAGDAIVVDAPIVESDTKNDDLNDFLAPVTPLRWFDDLKTALLT